MTEYFLQAFIYLTAAVIAVPLANKLGLGSMPGYNMTNRHIQHALRRGMIPAQEIE